MQTTEIMKMTVPSKLADLRDVPLAEMPTRSTVTLDEALDRVVPNQQATRAPAATFNSAI
jgi:FXSXX-COOH protein